MKMFVDCFQIHVHEGVRQNTPSVEKIHSLASGVTWGSLVDGGGAAKMFTSISPQRLYFTLALRSVTLFWRNCEGRFSFGQERGGGQNHSFC